MTFISYAQNFEDVMLWRALKHVERGFYIDVGAFSPDFDSVTRAFSERGWRGINIEPNPHYLAQLNARRPHDANLGIAVSDFDGEIELSVIEDTGLTTVETSIAKGHGDAGWALSHITVPTQTLAHVWDRHVPEGQAVHFLKVDVEGHEAAVLRGADWSRHRPWIVVVEATLPNSQVRSHAEWHGILEEAGYDFVYWDGLNRFYVAREHRELAKHFDTPPNVFDGFILDTQHMVTEKVERLERQISEQREAFDGWAAQWMAQRADFERRLDKEMLASARSVRAQADLERRLTEAFQLLNRVAEDGARLRQVVDEISGEVQRTSRHLDYLLHRGILERLLFRASGKPKKLVRRIMFHNSGKPRGAFRRWVLRRNGQPRKLFRMWMSSPAYQALPKAVMMHGLGTPSEEVPVVPVELSPRARYFQKRLDASQTRRPEA